MKTTLLLTKIFLKNSFNFKKNKNNKKTNIVGIILLSIFFVAYFCGIFGFMSFEMIKTLKEVNQETLFLGMMFLAILTIMVFQTIFTSINLFYFSKDIEFVLPMPIKPTQVLMAKFFNLVITEYIIEVLFLVAPLTVYGVLTNAGVLFYIYSILILLIFPILPLAIVCTIIMCIMAFSKLIKNKDRMQLVATIFTILIVVVIQVLSMQNEELTDEQLMQKMLEANGAVSIFLEVFITLKFSINALTNASNIIGFFELLKLISISGIGILIFREIGNKIYYKGVINSLGGGGSSSKKKLISNKVYQEKNIGKSYVIKEFKNLVRNSIFFMQCVLPNIILPVIMMIPFIFMKDDLGVELANETAKLLKMLYTPLGFTIVLCIIQFMSMMSFTAITAISRDGQNAVFMKYIPISLHKQFIYKIIPNILLSTIPIILVLATMKFFIIEEISIIYLILLYIVAMILNIIQSYCMLLIDLKKPKLEWVTEYAVVKQNFNLVYEIIYAFIVIAILGVIGYFTREMNFSIVVTLLTAITLVIFMLIDRYVKRNENKLFRKII